MRFFVLFFSIFMTSACSNHEQSAAFQTASGWPEIEINTKSKQAVVDNLIHRNVSNGWSLGVKVRAFLFSHLSIAVER